MIPSNNKIKQALESAVPKWDDDAIWDQIEQTLPAEGKKRNPILWWLSGLSVLVIGGLMFTYLSNSEITDSQSDLVKQIKKTNEDQQFDNGVLKETVSANVKREEIISIEKSDSNQSMKTDLGTTKQLKSERKSSNSDFAQAKLSAQSDTQVNAVQHTSIRNLAGTNLKYQIPHAKNSQFAANQNEMSSPEIFERKMISEFALLTRLGFYSISSVIETDKRAFQLDSLQTSISKETSKDRDSRQVEHAITVNSGVFATQRSLDAPNHLQWVESKNTQEELLETVDLNLQYQLRFQNNLEMGVGIGYSQINEKFVWRDTSLAHEDITYTSGIKTVTQRFEAKKFTTPNSFQSLYLPVSIGYRLQRNKWQYSVAIGGNIAVWNGFSGRYLATDFSRTASDSDQEIPINNSISLQSVTASLSCGYLLKEKLYLTGGLVGKLGLQNRLNNQSTALRYHGYGVQVGLRYEISGVK